MRGFASYFIAGLFVVLALGMIAPPAGLVFSPVGAAPAPDYASLHVVDRANKGDRMPVTTISKRQPETQAPPKMLTGCEPAFSPLSVSARANFARSCAT
jgi:hypothetical protein